MNFSVVHNKGSHDQHHGHHGHRGGQRGWYHADRRRQLWLHLPVWHLWLLSDGRRRRPPRVYVSVINGYWALIYTCILVVFMYLHIHCEMNFVLMSTSTWSKNSDEKKTFSLNDNSEIDLDLDFQWFTPGVVTWTASTASNWWRNTNCWWPPPMTALYDSGTLMGTT